MAKDGYKKTYQFLKLNHADQTTFTFAELAVAADYKITSIHTYYRNSLKNKFITQHDKNRLSVLDEIDLFTEAEFIQFCSQKKVDDGTELDLSDFLRENSIQCIFSAIELHNKPQIAYRYQTVAILLINAWELILKAYITKYFPDISIFQRDGNSKPFEQILDCVIDQLGKEYFYIRDNLKVLYEYRCEFIHFYEEDIDPLLYGLFQKSISNFNYFIDKFFKYRLEDLDDLHILPIGFKRPASPIDYLTETSSIEETNPKLKKLLLSIIDKTHDLNAHDIQETIIVPFSMLYKNEKRLKNADIVAAISGNKDLSIKIVEEVKLTDKEDVKKIKIEESSLFETVYTETYADVVTYCKNHIPRWKQNRDFHKHMREIKQIDELHKARFLDPNNEKSAKKDFYSKQVYKKLKDLYAD